MRKCPPTPAEAIILHCVSHSTWLIVLLLTAESKSLGTVSPHLAWILQVLGVQSLSFTV